jgi:hypothetical protein
MSVQSQPPADAPGASARREYERRAARELEAKQRKIEQDEQWRRDVVVRRPVLGRVIKVLTPRPRITPESQSTVAWKTGADGERRVAEALATVAGIEVLHDRLVPGSKANIDHVVVAPSGVYVVDAKHYTGRVEVRDVGGLLQLRLQLYVDGRNQTKLVEAMYRQIEVVRTALGDEGASVPVSAFVCFVGAEWGLRARPKHFPDVTVLWPAALAERVASDGPFEHRVPDLAARLRQQLRPA